MIGIGILTSTAIYRGTHSDGRDRGAEAHASDSPGARWTDPWSLPLMPDGVYVSSSAGLPLDDLRQLHEAAAGTPEIIEAEPLPPAAAEPAQVQSAAVAPYVAPVYSGSGVERWRELVDSIFPAWAVDRVLRIMECESGGDPDNTGSEGERGLLQIHPKWHPDATFDPLGNIKAAYRISSGGTDWSQWTCSRLVG